MKENVTKIEKVKKIIYRSGSEVRTPLSGWLAAEAAEAARGAGPALSAVRTRSSESFHEQKVNIRKDLEDCTKLCASKRWSGSNKYNVQLKYIKRRVPPKP